MKKKITGMLTAALLAMMMAAILTACGDDKAQKETATEQDTAALQDEQAAKTISTPTEVTDGTYKIEVAVKGGTGDESIQSPATVTVKDGQATAVVVWNSSDFDYMMVGGKKVEPVKTEGGSTFRISVPVFDEAFKVTAHSTAAGAGETEYSLTFDSAGLSDNAVDLDEEFAADKEAREKADQSAEDGE